MAGIQPYRYPESTYMPGDSRAANLAPTYRYPVSNMASGIRQHFWHSESLCGPQAANNMAIPGQQYSPGPMNYYYPRLDIGTTEPILITQVLAPYCFSCQLRSMSHEAQRLSESMQHYYQVQKSYGELGPQPALTAGQPCASMGADGRWYRSLLQGLFVDKPLATVIHVDWGGREIVPLSRLRHLAEEFLRLPVVTFPCALYDIANGGLDWDQRLVAEFCTMLHGKQVNAKIECFNSYERLYFVTLFAEDGTNLNHHFKTRSQNPTVTMPGLTVPLADDEKKVPSEQTLQSDSYVSKFPPVELKTSKFYDAEVVFVIDPFSFWVRLKMYAAEHKEMVDGMTTLYSQASKLEGIIAAPKPGQLCCARYEDLYCRAEVISLDERKQVKVYFLDDGILETVDWYNVKELPTKFTKLQALAVKCCIADTYPLEDTWSQEAIRAFKIVVTDRHLVIHVILKDADEYTIDIQDQSRIEERCIGKILANAGLARFEELDSVDGQSNSEKIGIIESSKAVLKPSAADYKPKIEKETAASYPCEENTETLQFSPFEDQLFEPGTTIEVVVSYIENPGLFWCQNARSRADLCTVMDAIQKQCMSTNSLYTSDTLACLAKSPKDDVWYRAFINEIPVNISKTTTVEVLYVDYGIRETVPLTNLRALNSEFFHLKAQAFKCSLYNIITPKGNNPFTWDTEATKVFSQFVQKASKWTEFHCIFYATASLDKEIFNIVDLYTPFASVCDELVQSGYATHLHHKTLASSVQLLTYYYSKHDLKLGDKEEIYITYVDSLSLFYLQLARSSNTIDRISATITKVLDKTPKKMLLSNCGSLCLAKFSDRQWYRGMKSENRSNEIFFVDYGNTEKLSKDDILPIMSSEHNILLVPVQAIKCSLSDIPSDVPGKIVSWFKNTVLDKPLKALFVAKDADGKFSIDLFDGEQKINETLKSKLGLRVLKEKSDNPQPAHPRSAKQEDLRKPPDNASSQEKKISFTVETSFKSRDFEVRSHSVTRDSEVCSHSVTRGPDSRNRSVTRDSDVRSHIVTRDFDSRNHSVTRDYDVRSNSVTRGPDSRNRSVTRDSDVRSHSITSGPDGRNHSVTRDSDVRSHSVTRGPDSRINSVTRDYDSRSHSVTRGPESRNLSVTRDSDSHSHLLTRGSDTRSHLVIAQEPERMSKKNPTFPYKTESKDYNSRYQESSFQRKTETIQRFPTSDSCQGNFGGRDVKQGGNKSFPQRQSSILAIERPSPAKPPVVVTLSDVPQRKIFCGMKKAVYVSHINSVFDFYVQVAEDSKLDEMSEILNKKGSLEELRDQDIHPGNVICAYFPDDGLYYRGVVTGKSRQGLCVQYIDYGNTSVISDCKNYSLPQKCCSVPVMSIFCSLEKPKNALSAPSLQEVLAKFSERTSDTHLDCEFQKQDGQKWEVILKDELGCLNDLLNAPEEPVKEEKIMKVVKEVEAPSVNAFNWNLPQPGATVKVYASAVDGPECFWCQLSTADMDSLASQVQEAGEKSVRSNDFIASLRVGSPCNVIFSEDNNWYRAMVTKMESDVVTVRFIDYGNEDSVGQDQIRQLPEPLVKISPQAFSCCLADFDMKAETWTSEGRNYFYEKVNEDMLELTIHEIQEPDESYIPVARVTIKCNGLDIREDVRQFLQGVKSEGLEVPDGSINLTPIDENQAVETDQPQVCEELCTTDVRAYEPEESALEGQYDEDCPLQEDVIEDQACSRLNEEQESDTDGVKEAVNLHHKAHNGPAVEDLSHVALKDQVPQDEFEATEEIKIAIVPGVSEDVPEFEEFEDCTEGPYEENNDPTDDVSSNHLEQGNV
ncbi:tudor domain-containing protein 6 [Hyla sarda]|uniref:tudor domain-containing protein 6 n=1 Tax=Hyla sarda TaxID=327740 RepID=UPI0024C3BBCD|nr:tudor domain-containing protein 6 [Hyla sarda]